MLDHIFQRRRLAAPPGRHRRHRQRLAEQPFAQRRQEAEQGAGFEHARTERIGHQHPAGADRAEQPRDAQRRVGAQFERIAEIVVEPAQDRMHPAQAAQGLQIDRVVAHGQVLPLDQRKAEIAGQEGVLEIGFVVRTGSQQHRQRRLAVGRRHARQIVLQRAKEARQGLHMQLAKAIRKGPRHDDPVLQRIACPGWPLGAVGDHPPAPVRRAGQIGRIQVQPGVARRAYALAGPFVAMLAIHQRRRQQALAQQPAFAVQITEDRIEQLRTLGDRAGDAGPLVAVEDQRQGVELPGPLDPHRVGIDVVGHAVGLDRVAHRARAFVEPARVGLVEPVGEGLPGGVRLARGGEHLVVAGGVQRVAVGQAGGHRGLSCARRAPRGRSKMAQV